MSTPSLPPRSQPEERERAIANALLVAVQKVPALESAVERLESAVLVASGAAARAEGAAERLERVVERIERRLDGTAMRDKVPSVHDLEKLADKVGELEDEVTSPGRAIPSDRVAAVAERVIDQRSLAEHEARAKLWRGMFFGVLGTVIAAALIGGGAFVWSQITGPRAVAQQPAATVSHQ